MVIPIEENQFVDGEKGVYLNLAGFEIKEKKGDSKDTHLVKQSFKKEVYEKMTEDEKVRAKDELQKIVDEANRNLETLFEKKEKEVLG